MDAVREAQSCLGELFLIGFNGLELSDDTSAFLSQAGIGGVLLFAHNYSNVEQVTELNNQVQECRKELPLWIAVDQEGGRVQRFKDPFTILPPAQEIGKMGSPRAAFDIGQITAKELSAVGVNLNFSPCVDILTNPENKVIGDRAFGGDAETVTRTASGIVRGHVVSGVQPCVKHFPGHGDTLEDSHDELPIVDLSKDQLRERELKPFIKTFKSRCNMTMVAHILNKQIDPEYPATLSKKTLSEFLRKELRFSKIIVSDDLEMEAISKQYNPEEAGVLAIEAG